jgi:putative ABC transport system ATP-binding protein
MIRTEQLQKIVATAAGPLPILKGITLQIKARESVAISGASGSGKSTLLGLLAGLDLPSSGRVWLAGREITALSEDQRAQLRAEQVGFVFQSFQLLPSLTALENVMLPLELRGQRNAHRAALEYLQRVGLGERQAHYPRQLSGGEQQRVAIARAIAKRPDVLLCDEPTGALDITTGVVVLDAIARVNREIGTATVVITHNAAIAGMADRVVRLFDGRVTAVTRNERKVAVSELEW